MIYMDGEMDPGKGRTIDPMDDVWPKECAGRGPRGYGDLYIFIQRMGQIVRIAEGTGDDLHPEDQEQGYVDHIYYEQYRLGAGMPEVDGGQVMLEELFREEYLCTADCIGDVLDMAYGDRTVRYSILAQVMDGIDIKRMEVG